MAILPRVSPFWLPASGARILADGGKQPQRARGQLSTLGFGARGDHSHASRALTDRCKMITDGFLISLTAPIERCTKKTWREVGDEQGGGRSQRSLSSLCRRCRQPRRRSCRSPRILPSRIFRTAPKTLPSTTSTLRLKACSAPLPPRKDSTRN